MPTFIQLRNGIGYAVVRAHGEVDHTVTPDHTTAIEVDDETAESLLKKKYNFDTKTWSDASLIRYAHLNERGEVIEILKTYFEHEADGPIITDDVVTNSTWKDGVWVPPRVVLPVEDILPTPVDEIADTAPVE